MVVYYPTMMQNRRNEQRKFVCDGVKRIIRHIDPCDVNIPNIQQFLNLQTIRGDIQEAQTPEIF
jgi:hypothetical protein